MKLQLREGQEIEIVTMLIECCAQERTYLRFYGSLGERFCCMKNTFQALFDEAFAKQYSMIHRLETNKLRNIAKFFAHLLHSNALPWGVMEYIVITEEETTSSSRIFIKVLFQEIAEYLGLKTLRDKLVAPNMQPSFMGLFPKDTARTRASRSTSGRRLAWAASQTRYEST